MFMLVDCMHRRAHHISTGFPAQIKIRYSLLPAEISSLDSFLGLDLPRTVVNTFPVHRQYEPPYLGCSCFPPNPIAIAICFPQSFLPPPAAATSTLNFILVAVGSSSTIAARVATIGNHIYSEPSISKRRPCCCSSADPPQPSFGRCQSSGLILLLLLLRLGRDPISAMPGP